MVFLRDQYDPQSSLVHFFCRRFSLRLRWELMQSSFHEFMLFQNKIEKIPISRPNWLWFSRAIASRYTDGLHRIKKLFWISNRFWIHTKFSQFFQMPCVLTTIFFRFQFFFFGFTEYRYVDGYDSLPNTNWKRNFAGMLSKMVETVFIQHISLSHSTVCCCHWRVCERFEQPWAQFARTCEPSSECAHTSVSVHSLSTEACPSRMYSYHVCVRMYWNFLISAIHGSLLSCHAFLCM